MHQTKMMVHILKTTIPFNTTQPCSAARLPLRPSGGGHPRVPAPAPPGLGEDPGARLPLQAHRPRLRAGPASPRHRQQSRAGGDQVTLIPELSDTTLMKVRVLGRPGIDTTFQHESRRYFPTRPCVQIFWWQMYLILYKHDYLFPSVVIQLLWLVNTGRLLSLCSDDTIYLWEVLV